MKLKYESFLPDVLKLIDKSDLLARRKAAQHLARRVRKNISGKGQSSPGSFPSEFSGGLKKSVAVKTTKNREVLMGVKAPHAHLVEDGHEPNKTKSKRPFFKRTFKEEKDKMIDIMSEKWF